MGHEPAVQIGHALETEQGLGEGYQLLQRRASSRRVTLASP